MGWSWHGRELRRVVQSIARDQQLAILLDRRINPNRPFDGDFSSLSVQHVLQQIAGRVGAETRFVGSTVYVGPPHTCARLRTAVRLLHDRLDEVTRNGNRERRNQLRKRRNVRWDDLQEPRLLVQAVAAQYHLEVSNLERVPHDLWAAATLPQTNAVESLMLILSQHELWFRWKTDATGIEIVRLPDTLAIEKRYPVSATLANQTANRWKRELPGILVERIGQQALLVKATLEQHEMIVSRGASSQEDPMQRNPRVDVVPINKRTFTLAIKDLPATALIKKLEMSGIEFLFDARQLKGAGIDLKQRIQMRVTMADAEAFFHAMFDQMQIRFEIQGTTVRLEPR
ncbi:MAG: hypothetical protein ABGZ35_26525 [Planctomycetaceae bacterium]